MKKKKKKSDNIKTKELKNHCGLSQQLEFNFLISQIFFHFK